MKERQKPDAEKDWHTVAVTAEMFYDYCQERRDKEDTE